MAQGTIKKIVSDRGFGFIAGDEGDIFFHISAVENANFDDLHEGQQVEFELADSQGDRGGKGPRASRVSPV